MKSISRGIWNFHSLFCSLSQESKQLSCVSPQTTHTHIYCPFHHSIILFFYSIWNLAFIYVFSVYLSLHFYLPLRGLYHPYTLTYAAQDRKKLRLVTHTLPSSPEPSVHHWVPYHAPLQWSYPHQAGPWNPAPGHKLEKDNKCYLICVTVKMKQKY